MRLNKLFLIGAVALGLGLTACNSDEVPNPDNGGDGNTYVGISIAFPGAKTTRALPGDFNSNGQWDGRDNIETITVFLVNETAKTVDYTTFDKNAFNGINASGFLQPVKAVKATPGNKVKAYVVVNGKTEILNTLKAKSADDFGAAFSAAADALASEVAAYSVIGADKKETIMMTNATLPTAKNIAPNVTEDKAKDGTSNRIDVNVERVASRAMVTIKTGYTNTINVKNAQGTNASVVTISDVKYAVGQSNKKLFIMKPFNGTDPATATPTWVTPDPVYPFVPTTASNWSTGNTILDYAGLTAFTTVQTAADKSEATVKTALNDEATSKFVLPITHQVTGTYGNTGYESKYKKGNTTYFEIRATFTPDQLDGGAYSGAATTVYLGMNDGKFYSTRALAIANGQKAMEYKDGIMKYVIWLNPNKAYNQTGSPINKITESPTVRNQVYHAHITGFSQIGLGSNPLNPSEPTPDPSEPINPIKPEDPLQNEDTYLSVSIQVLKWGIHSYEVNLDNEY